MKAEEIKHHIEAQSNQFSHTNQKLRQELTKLKQAELQLRHLNLKKNQQLQKVHQKFKDLNLLLEASTALSNILDTDTVLEIIFQKIIELMAVDWCIISKWHPEKGTMTLYMSYPTSTNSSSESHNSYSLAHYPLVRDVLIQNQPQLIHLAEHPLEKIAWKALENHKFGSLLMLPLATRDKTIGLLELLTFEERNYTASEMALGQTLAQQIATTIDNVYIFEQVRSYIKKLEGYVTVSTQEMVTTNQKLRKEITERQQIEASLRKSEEQFRLIFELAPTGMLISTTNGQLVRVNQAFCDIIGYTEMELISTKFTTFMHPDDITPNLAMQEKVLRGEIPFYQMETRYLHKDGNIIYVILQVVLIRDTQNQPLNFVGQIVDITERKRAEQKLLHNAFHDSLTGLPNRILFADRLERSIGHAKRYENYLFAVLFLDLDRFKVINDGLGHLVGDQLLIAIAQRLKECIRPGDTLARLGGDEFAILLDDINMVSEVEQLANQIQHQVSLPIKLNQCEVSTTTSIGITLSLREYDKPEELLRDAHIAMYRAKAWGGASHKIFKSSMHTTALMRLQLEIELRQAIEQEKLEIYYQPVVSLSDYQITGVEALVRWPHPQQGYIPPAEFIPLAEETGLIISLGQWLLKTACAQMKRWHLEGYPVRLAVNISARQFQYQDLPALIEEVLEETQLDALALELEITESIAMLSDTFSITPLNKLSKMGIHISIDDFGTGYSSLSRLKSLPINTLKIDHSFVKDIIHNPDDATIVAATIAMAHSLKLKVIAEGVEAKEQLRFLRIYGCDEMQGYLFSPPVPAKKLRQLLEENRNIQYPLFDVSRLQESRS